MRLFVAIPMPDACTAALARVTEALPLGRTLDPENLHLTLAFLGEMDRATAEEAHMALETIRAARFDIQPKGLGTFAGRSPQIIWAGIADHDPITTLAAKVRSVLHGAGMMLERRRFVPHVTLARLSRPSSEEDTRLARFLSRWDSFSSPAATVEQFALYQSHLRPDGAQYEIIASYDLE